MAVSDQKARHSQSLGSAGVRAPFVMASVTNDATNAANDVKAATGWDNKIIAVRFVSTQAVLFHGDDDSSTGVQIAAANTLSEWWPVARVPDLFISVGSTADVTIIPMYGVA